MFSLFSRSTLCALLSLLTIGCNQQSDSSTTTKGLELEQKLKQEPEEIDSYARLDPLTSENDLLKNSKTDPEITDEMAESEPVSDDSLEKETAKNPQNIVADVGFSGTTTLPIEQATQEYCLSKKNVSDYTITEACGAISNRLASISMQSCSSAQLIPTGCDSVKGFPILSREFAPLENKLPRGRILLIGGTHGDELTSVSITFKWIEKLNKHHSGLFHWHIVPLMNPDGVLKKAASRTNHNGVDLNRNMPSDDWERNAISYWENRGSKNPRKYPGLKAASEPETQWLIDEINTFKPDAIISVHAPYGVVDFDAQRLNTAPKSLGKLHLNLLGTYPGSLGNYAGINRDIPVITLELPHSWVMPSEAETNKIWEDIVTWLRNNIDNRVAEEKTEDAKYSTR